MKKNEIQELKKLIKDVLYGELAGVLNDVRYRIESLYASEIGRANARDLMLPYHQLDGFTVADNSPSNGSIAWVDCNIVYKGVNYPITNGNTAMKYVWWDFSATDKTKFISTNTKPELTDDDVLVFVNIGGIHHTEINSGKMTHGATLMDGTINSAEIANGAIKTLNLAGGAVNSTILADGAVVGGKIAPKAVDSAKIADNAVSGDKIASGAVTAAKIGANAVSAEKIVDGAVSTGKIANNAVSATKIADNAVTDGKISNGAVTNTKIASGAVNSDKLASGAVTNGKISDGAITGIKIGAGQVGVDKLNAAMHMIF